MLLKKMQTTLNWMIKNMELDEDMQYTLNTVFKKLNINKKIIN